MTTELKRLVLIALASSSMQAMAQSEVKYFQKLTPELDESITLWISGDVVGGNMFSGSEGTHSAFGRITGVVRPDGILHVTWNYEIEGSEQSEEQLLKLAEDSLFIGEGELEERGPGQMVLKDPAKVVFEKKLEPVVLNEPEIDSEEAKPFVAAILDAIPKIAGGPVTLNGKLRITQGWLRFTGLLSPVEGQKLQNETFAERMESSDFEIFLKQDGEGGWKLIRHGFRSPEGYFEFEEASEDYEAAPWPIDEEPEF